MSQILYDLDAFRNTSFLYLAAQERWDKNARVAHEFFSEYL